MRFIRVRQSIRHRVLILGSRGMTEIYFLKLTGHNAAKEGPGAGLNFGPPVPISLPID